MGKHSVAGDDDDSDPAARKREDAIRKAAGNLQAIKAEKKPFSVKAQEIIKALNTDPDKFEGTRKMLHEFISHTAFDTGVGLVIMFNAVTIGLESQSKASVPIGCTPECDCKNQVYPQETCYLPEPWLEQVDYGFFVVYAIELCLRFGVYGPFVLRSHWVKFDAFLVVSSVLDFIMKAVGDSDQLAAIMLVRILRLFRLARAVRLMVQFRTLWKLVQGLFHCLGTLLWTLLLMIILMYIWAVIGMEFIRLDPNIPLDHPYNVVVSDNFQTFEDAMMMLLQCFSFDSIGGVYRPISKHSPQSFTYFLVGILFLSIALMNLVTAVMVNSSLEQGNEDKEAMKAWEAVQRKKQMDELKTMFLELDEDGSGELSMAELHAAPEDAQEALQTIAATDDLDSLFQLLDYDGGGTLAVGEFCDGVLKATTGAPGCLEYSRLVKQCSSILVNYREAVEILGDGGNGIVDFIKAGGGGDGGGGGNNNDAANLEALKVVDDRVGTVEKNISALKKDLSRVKMLVNDKLALIAAAKANNRSPSRRAEDSPPSRTVPHSGSPDSHSHSRRRQQDDGRRRPHRDHSRG